MKRDKTPNEFKNLSREQLIILYKACLKTNEWLHDKLEKIRKLTDYE